MQQDGHNPAQAVRIPTITVADNQQDVQPSRAEKGEAEDDNKRSASTTSSFPISHQGIQIHRSIVYGSCARLLTPSEQALAPPGHSHRWHVFLASATSPPPKFKPGRNTKGFVPGPDDVLEEDLDWTTGGADDLSWLIKRVTFKLHDTYPSPNRGK